MTQFVSALELATYFDGTTDLTDLTPEWVAQADLLLQMISADVEAAAGVPIKAGALTVFLAGTWARDLELPAGPIISISAITIDGVALGSGEWTYNDRTLLRRGSDFGLVDSLDNAIGYPQHGSRARSGLSWGGPASTVAVDFVFSAVVPGVVKSLVLRIAARTFGNVSNITQESLAIYSVTYGNTKETTDSGSHVTAAERKRIRNAVGARSAGTFAVQGR